jgi:pyridoxal phosphate-dependent aminotransferase EpsN
VYLSPPHLGDEEARLVADAIASNWIAPLGPHVDAFEAEFGALVGSRHAVALSSGTAALHLALLHKGVGPGDRVIVSTLTFAASANPVRYLGAEPVFIDSEPKSWNMDPDLLQEALADTARRGQLPKAVVLVHLYGQAADVDAITGICDRYEVPLVEDAAEALGASYHGRAPGTFGVAGIFSFNGNKIVTTSGGGMLVTEDADFATHVRKLATQARDPAPHYQHSEIGYNYRLSNVLAAIGRGQIRVLQDRVAARRRVFEGYRRDLGDLPGIGFMPEAEWGRATRWLTVITVDAAAFGADRESIRLALEAENIEARPVWKPMHMQPVYRDAEVWGGDVSRQVFERGLCLPSGSNLEEADRQRVTAVVRGLAG